MAFLLAWHRTGACSFFYSVASIKSLDAHWGGGQLSASLAEMRTDSQSQTKVTKPRLGARKAAEAAKGVVCSPLCTCSLMLFPSPRSPALERGMLRATVDIVL